MVIRPENKPYIAISRDWIFRKPAEIADFRADRREADASRRRKVPGLAIATSPCMPVRG